MSRVTGSVTRGRGAAAATPVRHERRLRGNISLTGAAAVYLLLPGSARPDWRSQTSGAAPTRVIVTKSSNMRASIHALALALVVERLTHSTVTAARMSRMLPPNANGSLGILMPAYWSGTGPTMLTTEWKRIAQYASILPIT